MKRSIFLLYFSFGFVVSIAQERPKVVAIYPLSDSLPVNIMRFYIEFSQPIQEMNIYDHVKLKGRNRRVMDSVFYKHAFEFWNNERTKVSLLIDPARVKRGLIANNNLGRAFKKEEQYHLEVDSLLLNFKDQPLQHSYKKTFVAVHEDMDAPNPEKWKIQAVKGKTKEPLVINFEDKIDHISALTLIRVLKNGKPVAGHFKIIDDTEITFVPDEKWHIGEYQLRIGSQLEDVAANSVNQVFDHDIKNFKTDILPYYKLSFEVKNPTPKSTQETVSTTMND